MRPSTGRRILLMATAATLVGCSDNPTGPGSPTAPDVAALLAEMSSSTLNSAAAIASPIGAAFNSSAIDPGGCQYSAATGFFECPAVTLNGLTFTRSFRLIDDAGSSQSKPDTHTSAIETKTTVDGTISTTTPGTAGGISSSLNYTVHGSSDDTLSGIQTSTHTLDGTSVTNVTGTMQLGTDTFPIDETVNQTTASLVLPNVRTGQRWPQSGTITMVAMLGTNGSGGTTETQITFNGTSVVTITTTNYFGTTTCRVDLSNPAGGLSACTSG